MSKSRDRQHVHEESDKKHPSSDGPGAAPGKTGSTGEAPGQSAPAESRPVEARDQAAELARLQDQFLRLKADFDNFRKRTLREKNEIYDNANQALMLELLPVLDHLHLGLEAASAHKVDPAFREGLTLIFDQFMGVLTKFGLSLIEAENKVFDPNLCEAVNTMPSAAVPEGKVLALVRRGYTLRNKLLRPAQVIVSSGPPPEPKADGGRQTTDSGQAKAQDGSDEG